MQVGAEEELDDADLAQVTSDDVADEPAGQEAGIFILYYIFIHFNNSIN